MKKMLCLTAAFALTATAAFGQNGNIDMPQNPDRLGASIVFRDVGGSTAEAAGFIEVIKRMLERSRILHLVPVSVPGSMELEAPLSMVKDASGARVTIKYEVTPPDDIGGGGSRTYSVTCAATQLDRCADDIVRRAERVARESKFQG